MVADIEKGTVSSRIEDDEAHAARVTEVFVHHRGRLFAWLCRKAPRDEAEEIVAKAFINVLEAGKSVYPVGNLPAYVYKSARNQLSNFYRDRTVRRARLVRLIPEGMETCDSLESVVLKEERQNALIGAINRLPPRGRMAFQLRMYEGLSCKEIAARFAERGLNVTERTVLRDIRSAYEACRRALEAWEDSCSGE
jgi:RNA polymerase sigma factor (sigma-70 family)